MKSTLELFQFWEELIFVQVESWVLFDLKISLQLNAHNLKHPCLLLLRLELKVKFCWKGILFLLNKMYLPW